MFTGSTEVARLLQRNIAGRLDNQGRPIPLIAETGGQNAMIVDSSALTEQVVIDVVSSAFDSAGQRCSALRVLCLQEDSADRVIEMLKGAMAESRLGNPERLSVDIGPVIDAEAKAGIEKHIQAMRDKGRSVYQVAIADSRRNQARHLRDADPDRAGKLRRAATRDLRPGAARGALQAQGHRPADRPDQRLRLRPDPGRAHPHRRDHRQGDRQRQRR
jgi:hypothetical protein